MPTRPPTRAPARKAASARIEAETDTSLAPATAKRRKTIFPVMFATKTWPSFRKLTASSKPVPTVSTKRRSGRGSCRSSLRAATAGARDMGSYQRAMHSALSASVGSEAFFVEAGQLLDRSDDRGEVFFAALLPGVLTDVGLLRHCRGRHGSR